MFAFLKKKAGALTIGLAMFAMFFGAGNIVFPLTLGTLAPEGPLLALIGFLFTAVLVPFLGLVTIILFNGDYMSFFARLGKQAGFALAFFILLMMGPFGALPRCITTSYSTMLSVAPNLSLPLFALVTIILLFFCTIKTRYVIKLLGLILTPLLILSLISIIVKGLWIEGQAIPFTTGTIQNFAYGFFVGYNTMDLFAAFFFATIVILSLKRHETDTLKTTSDHHLLLRATYIGIGLLIFMYTCFTILSTKHSNALLEVPQSQLLGSLANHILGSSGAWMISLAVFFACFKTEIAVSVIVAEFLHLSLFKGKVSYVTALIATLVVSYLISTLRFEGIAKYMGPILQIIYPALIILTLCNAAYKIFNFKPVKIPVLLSFLISFIAFGARNQWFTLSR